MATSNDVIDNVNGEGEISISVGHTNGQYCTETLNNGEPDVEIRVLQSFCVWFFDSVAGTYSWTKSRTWIIKNCFELAESVISHSRIDYVVRLLFNKWLKICGPTFGSIDKRLGDRIVQIFVAALVKAGVEAEEHVPYRERVEYLLFGKNCITDGRLHSEMARTVKEKNDLAASLEEKDKSIQEQQQKINDVADELNSKLKILQETEELLNNERVMFDQLNEVSEQKISLLKEQMKSLKQSLTKQISDLEAQIAKKNRHEEELNYQIAALTEETKQLRMFEASEEGVKRRSLEDEISEAKILLYQKDQEIRALKSTKEKFEKAIKRYKAKKTNGENVPSATNSPIPSPRPPLPSPSIATTKPSTLRSPSSMKQ